MNEKYVLITPARNEEKFIENTILSICQQTLLPSKWVIVSDGSTDRTDDIAKSYMTQNSFIYLLRIEGDRNRNFGSQLRAIQAGNRELKGIEYEFIGNLDADITFEKNYFEDLISKFRQNPKLGLAGGYVYEKTNGKYSPRKFNTETSVPHAVQLFRRKCYEDIGGYIALPYGGGDTHAETMARMKGWNVRSFSDLKAFHYRITLGSEGRMKGAWRQGLMDYSLGVYPPYELIRCFIRLFYNPLILYSISRLSGYIWASLRREPRSVSKEFISFSRWEQKTKIKSCLKIVKS